jgi:superfamily II DNA/RNA helicase
VDDGLAAIVITPTRELALQVYHLTLSYHRHITRTWCTEERREAGISANIEINVSY